MRETRQRARAAMSSNNDMGRVRVLGSSAAPDVLALFATQDVQPELLLYTASLQQLWRSSSTAVTAAPLRVYEPRWCGLRRRAIGLTQLHDSDFSPCFFTDRAMLFGVVRLGAVAAVINFSTSRVCAECALAHVALAHAALYDGAAWHLLSLLDRYTLAVRSAHGTRSIDLSAAPCVAAPWTRLYANAAHAAVVQTSCGGGVWVNLISGATTAEPVCCMLQLQSEQPTAPTMAAVAPALAALVIDTLFVCITAPGSAASEIVQLCARTRRVMQRVQLNCSVTALVATDAVTLRVLTASYKMKVLQLPRAV